MELVPPPTANEILETLSTRGAQLSPPRPPSPVRTMPPSRIPSVGRVGLPPPIPSPIPPPTPIPPPVAIPLAVGAQQRMFNNQAEMVAENSVDAILMKHGYIPVSRVYMEEGPEAFEALFIKAHNKLGYTVYVIPDVQGYLSVDEGKDLSVVRCLKGDILPHSVKEGTMQCMGNDVCGVVMECGGGGICSLIKEGAVPELRERGFLYKEGMPERTLTELDKLVPYPVFRLSEIVTNPLLVLKNTIAVSNRLRNAAFKMCEEKMDCLLDNLANVASLIKKFVELRHLVHCGLKEKMHHLRLKLDALEPSTCMRDKQLRCKILHNIIVREEMQTKVLELCKRLLPLENMLLDVTENLSIGIDGLGIMAARLENLFEISRDMHSMFNL